MHSILKTRPISSIRRPSLAGDGMAERMRSTAFALLGLLAAASLTLVALFAQPGFPLLEPAPLPDEPTLAESVADAQKATAGHRVPVAPAAPPDRTRSGAAGGGSASPGSREPAGGDDPPAAEPVAAETPAPGGVTASPGGKAGGGGSGHKPAGPAPAVAPAPPAAAPVSTPQPAAPEAIASSPPAEPAPAPGNSASPAAAEHASEHGIESSSTAAAGAQGNGNAIGQSR